MSSDNLDSGCSTCGSDKSLNNSGEEICNRCGGRIDDNNSEKTTIVINRKNSGKCPKSGDSVDKSSQHHHFHNSNSRKDADNVVKFGLSPPLPLKSDVQQEKNCGGGKVRLNSDTDYVLAVSGRHKSRAGLELSPKHLSLDARLNSRSSPNHHQNCIVKQKHQQQTVNNNNNTRATTTTTTTITTLPSSSSGSRSSSQESFAKFCCQSQRNSLSGNDQPKSPGGSSNSTSISAEFAYLASCQNGTGGVGNGAKQQSRRGTASSNNSTLNAATRFFRFPVVKQYFFRKKKSWPTLNVGGMCGSDDLKDSDDLAVTELENGINNSVDVNDVQLLSGGVENNAAAAVPSSRIVNTVTNPNNSNPNNNNSGQQKLAGHSENCQQQQIRMPRKTAGRIPSKEDPGPSRDLLDPLLMSNGENLADQLGLGTINNNQQQQTTLNNVNHVGGCCPCPVTVANLNLNLNLKNFSCFSNSQLFAYNLPPNGSKFKFIHEGQIQVCRLNHSRTVLGKLSSSKLLRRWENHFLTLGDDEISSKTPVGFMEQPLKYATMEDVHALPQWDSCADKYCIRIFVPEGSILLQTNHAYTRNQWLYSIQWRRNLYRYRRMIELSSGRPEVLLKETKCLVEQVKCCPLQGDNLSLKSVVLIARLLEQIFAGSLPRTMIDPIITCVAPLLDTVCTVTEVSPFLSKYCNDYPRSRLIGEVLSDVAQQTLKKTMDFGKYPSARIFVQDFLLAINSQNNGRERIKNFVNNVHGLTSSCPHPRVLPNFVAICLAAVHALFDPQICINNNEKCAKLECYCSVFEVLSEFEDWRMPLSSLLQPMPFPEDVLANPTFASCFGQVLKHLGSDARCEIHLTLLGVREGKEGWFHLVCPGGPVCSDDGELFSSTLKTLLHCCCRRKKFLQGLNGMLGPLQLLALRENEPCMEALCHMLEFEVVEGEDLKLQMITALQSTSAGKKHYAALCDRQIALRELQQKGGPRKLTLPSKSTDSDLAVLLSSGSFGNLEWLSLAFTNVTSACADYLIKLPSLRYLNLWSTQFGDSGLQLLSEHLSKLQVLNLCETPMTDKGLLSLSALKNLRKLNLNSTQLSAKTFLILKTELPALQEVDVRYTDAWCADDFVA